MKKIYFSPPATKAFLETLNSLWSEEDFSAHLIGNNDLADDLAAVALKKGISVPRSDALPVASSNKKKKKKKQLLILTEKSGEELSKQLLSCVDLDNVVIVAPITDWHFSQKPLFLVSIPKSGTHLLYELVKALGYHKGVEAPEFPLGQTWYCVEYTNSHTVARDFFVDTVRRSPFGNRYHSFMHSPALFMYRHPLDILISEANYYHQDGKTAFSGWFDGADFDERVSRLLNDNWLMGSLRERIGGFLPWLNIPNVIPLSFEELIGAAGGGNDVDQLHLIWSIQLKLQAPGDPQEISSHIFNPDSATFRSGQIGGYKKYLPENMASDFVVRNEDILTKMGYLLDGSVTLPVNREFRRNRGIRFSSVDYENMPFTIESDFMGCNLVRYSGCIYAIPLSAGPVSLEELPAEMLAVFPSASSLSEVKTLLLIGNDDLSFRRQSLDKLAQAIQGSVPAQNVYLSLTDSHSPIIIEQYNGFNLISFQNCFFGIRQTIGAVDLSGNLLSLVQSTAFDDFLIARSLDQLRDDIDGISTSKRIYLEAAAGDERILAIVGVIETQLAQLQTQILEQQQQICALQAPWAVRVARIIKRVLRGKK